MHFGTSGMLLSDLQAHSGGLQYLQEVDGGVGEEDLEEQVEWSRRNAAATLVQAWWRGVRERGALVECGTLSAGGASVGDVAAAAKPEGVRIRKGEAVPLLLPYWTDKYDDATVDMEIGAISIEFLIRRLTQPGVDASKLAPVFLLTHSIYLPSARLLAYLELRYFSLPGSAAAAGMDAFVANEQPQLRVKVLELLCAWIASAPYEFPPQGAVASGVSAFLARAREGEERPEVVAALDKVGGVWEQRVAAASAAVVSVLADLDEDGGDGGRVTMFASAAAPSSLLLTSKPLHTMAQLHPLEVVRQLSLLDYEVFSRIEPNEFLAQAWAGRGAEMRAPYVLAMIKRFNDTVAWARTEVLKCDGPKYRARMICIMLDVANNFLALNNYNGLMAVVSALEGAALTRLKYTWELLPAAYEALFVDLKEVMSMTHNYRTYRDKLKAVSGACVPYIGVMLQDLTFIDDGNPAFVSKVDGAPMVNMAKHAMTYEVVSELLGLRDGGPYVFHPVPTVQAYLQHAAPKWDENKCYSMSLEHEPRGMKPPPKGRRKKIVYTRLEGSEVADFDLGRNARFLDDMMSRMTLLEAAPGQVIVQAGEVGREMFFIASGQVAVNLPTGGDLALNMGSFFGEIAIFLDTVRTATVVASTDVVCYVLKKSVVDEVLRSYPEMQGQFRALAEARVAMNEGDAGAELPAWMRKLAGRATAVTVKRVRKGKR